MVRNQNRLESKNIGRNNEGSLHRDEMITLRVSHWCHCSVLLAVHSGILHIFECRSKLF